MSYFGFPRPRSSLSRRQEFTLTILMTLCIVAVGARVIWHRCRGASDVIRSINTIRTTRAAELLDGATPAREGHK